MNYNTDTDFYEAIEQAYLPPGVSTPPQDRGPYTQPEPEGQTPDTPSAPARKKTKAQTLVFVLLLAAAAALQAYQLIRFMGDPINIARAALLLLLPLMLIALGASKRFEEVYRAVGLPTKIFGIVMLVISVVIVQVNVVMIGFSIGNVPTWFLLLVATTTLALLTFVPLLLNMARQDINTNAPTNH